jgi:acyl carrier protein
MTHTHMAKEEIMVVYPRIAEAIAAALPCEVKRVKFEASLIEDYGAQSIDFLDVAFRLARAAAAVSKPS